MISLKSQLKRFTAWFVDSEGYKLLTMFAATFSGVAIIFSVVNIFDGKPLEELTFLLEWIDLLFVGFSLLFLLPIWCVFRGLQQLFYKFSSSKLADIPLFILAHLIFIVLPIEDNFYGRSFLLTFIPFLLSYLLVYKHLRRPPKYTAVASDTPLASS